MCPVGHDIEFEGLSVLLAIIEESLAVVERRIIDREMLSLACHHVCLGCTTCSSQLPGSQQVFLADVRCHVCFSLHRRTVTAEKFWSAYCV